MTADVESIVDGFPHNTISPVIGMPTYATISEVNLRLNANAASVQSDHGDGTLGLLALTVTPAVYSTLTDTPFELPINPGPNPGIPANATGAQIEANTRAHKENLRIWREYIATDKALKQQLLAAIQEMYYKTLRHRITDYATISTKQILTHLYATYGNITPADLADNDARLKAPFDPSQPIEILFDQIEDAVDLAAAAQAEYTQAQIVAYAYNLIFQTGVFHDACRDWRRRFAADRTWATFKTDFAIAHQELRESQLTAQGAGFHTANSVTFDEIQTQTADALANLATATASDRSTVSALTNTNSTLTEALATATTQLKTAQADISALKTKVTRLEGNPSTRSNTRTDNRKPKPTTRFYFNENYCWSHGYHIHEKHTSETCRWPKDNHKREATKANTMNGSTYLKELVT